MSLRRRTSTLGPPCASILLTLKQRCRVECNESLQRTVVQGQLPELSLSNVLSMV
jgi:hypothetical protein